jgi:hypothetical protein
MSGRPRQKESTTKKTPTTNRPAREGWQGVGMERRLGAGRLLVSANRQAVTMEA